MNRDNLTTLGWRRHSVIAGTDELAQEISNTLPQKISDLIKKTGSIIIITTYDCAVVSDCFDSEPWLQLLVAIPTEYKKEFASGRNPRKLHFKASIGDIVHEFETTAVGICQTKRELIKSYTPKNAYTLTQETQTELTLWLCERYRQETWPDAFNRALNPANKKIKRLWKKYNAYSSAVYIKLHTYEELDSEKYTISVIFAVEPSKTRALNNYIRSLNGNNNKSIDDVKKVLINEIVNAFGSTINFAEDPTQPLMKAVEIIEENHITLQMLRNYSKFSPYSLSLENQEGTLPVDVLPL